MHHFFVVVGFKHIFVMSDLSVNAMYHDIVRKAGSSLVFMLLLLMVVRNVTTQHGLFGITGSTFVMVLLVWFGMRKVTVVAAMRL